MQLFGCNLLKRGGQNVVDSADDLRPEQTTDGGAKRRGVARKGRTTRPARLKTDRIGSAQITTSNKTGIASVADVIMSAATPQTTNSRLVQRSIVFTQPNAAKRQVRLN